MLASDRNLVLSINRLWIFPEKAETPQSIYSMTSSEVVGGTYTERIIFYY